MKPYSLNAAFYICGLGAMPLFFFILGFRGIITRKPFVISSRWLMAVITLGFSLLMFQSITLLTLYEWSPKVKTFAWLYPLLLLSVLVFLWFTSRWYVAIGITDKLFRDGLLASLSALNLSYERNHVRRATAVPGG
jgi:hypothetical protein